VSGAVDSRSRAREAATPLGEVIRGHARRLAAAGVASPDHDVRRLARHALGLGPAEFSLATTADVPAERLGRLHRLVTARAARVPLQHLTGESGFRRLTLRCRPGVFIPRLETEVLAGLAIESAAAVDGRAVVVDVCTGTGAIALSVANEVPGVEVHATDASPAAVALARANLEQVRVSPGLAEGATCTITHGDLLAPVPGRLRGHLDVLVSNPPYLAEVEWDAAEPEVRDHDPRGALVADEGGHAIVGRLVRDGLGWLKHGGWLMLEVNEHRVPTALRAAAEAGYDDVAAVADLTGRDRFVVARRPGGGPRGSGSVDHGREEPA
jgi:release factor glutamine methyltransferase